MAIAKNGSKNRLDYSGRIIYLKEVDLVKGKHTMDISSQINLENMPRGIYNFRIEMDRQVVVEKLLRL